ncbi:MAG: 1-deoxy-D-xylulose-5-phosphate reductoisomerase [Phycisphaerae bacterium]|nr:1-deoxy-D-xylulose-5-phosphate reductoisomerase [Phycisphaerae bacterium]
MNDHSCSSARRLIVLGSTGSIGVGVLDVVAHLDGAEEPGPRFQVVGLAAGTRGVELERQAARFNVDAVALADPGAAGAINSDRRLHVGPNAALEIVQETARPGDLVIAAMVGAAGIPAVLAAIEIGCDIALANKETLVAAGSVVTTAAARRGVSILPIDSEHAAVHQCLRSGRTPSEISKIVLTASGGPFRTWPIERIRNATVTEALAHPTWTMGRKVTIDSASMMNKGLELIEAHWLFEVDADRLDAIVHPQSIVHSFVEFTDGSSIGQLSPPDMRMPIQYAMCHPTRVAGCAPHLDFASLRELAFEPIDHDRFPAVGLALAAIRAGGTSGAILNAANETAVEAFLNDEIPFGRISSLVESALAEIDPVTADSLEIVLDADQRARALVHEKVRSPVAGS